MKVKAEDVVVQPSVVENLEDLEKVLDLSIDDAISVALNKSEHGNLDPAWYDMLLEKLGETERAAFTQALVDKNIIITEEEPMVMTASQELKLDELKEYFIALVEEQGYVYEDDYHDIVYGNLDSRIAGELNLWFIGSGLPIRRNPPGKRVRNEETDYKKKVREIAKNPDVRKLKDSQQKMKRMLSAKNRSINASTHLNKALDLLKEPNKDEDTEFLPPWKKKLAQAEGELVFHAKTRGNRFEIKVFERSDGLYDIREYKRGDEVGVAKNHSEDEAIKRLHDQIAYAAGIDGINYQIVLDDLGITKKEAQVEDEDILWERINSWLEANVQAYLPRKSEYAKQWAGPYEDPKSEAIDNFIADAKEELGVTDDQISDLAIDVLDKHWPRKEEPDFDGYGNKQAQRGRCMHCREPFVPYTCPMTGRLIADECPMCADAMKRKEVEDLEVEWGNKEAHRYLTPAGLKQIGPNMHELDAGDYNVLFSYETPVAYYVKSLDQYFKTDKFHSKTTSTHINKWIKDPLLVSTMPQSKIDELIAELYSEHNAAEGKKQAQREPNWETKEAEKWLLNDEPLYLEAIRIAKGNDFVNDIATELQELFEVYDVMPGERQNIEWDVLAMGVLDWDEVSVEAYIGEEKTADEGTGSCLTYEELEKFAAESHPFEAGDRVVITSEGLMWSGKQLPPSVGRTQTQIDFDNKLRNLSKTETVGTIERTFPGSYHLNVDFDGEKMLIGLDARLLEKVLDGYGKKQAYKSGDPIQVGNKVSWLKHPEYEHDFIVTDIKEQSDGGLQYEIDVPPEIMDKAGGYFSPVLVPENEIVVTGSSLTYDELDKVAGEMTKQAQRKKNKQKWMREFDDLIQELNPEISNRRDYWDTAAYFYDQGFDPGKAARTFVNVEKRGSKDKQAQGVLQFGESDIEGLFTDFEPETVSKSRYITEGDLRQIGRFDELQKKQAKEGLTPEEEQELESLMKELTPMMPALAKQMKAWQIDDWEEQSKEIKAKINELDFVVDESIIDQPDKYDVFVRISSFKCNGNNPMGTYLGEDFVTVEWAIDVANQEIENREVKRTTKVATLREAVDVLNESKIVHVHDIMTWKCAQRIDEEKRQLEDTIRSRQEQIPGWKKLLERVRKAFDFSELRDVWSELKELPAFASCESEAAAYEDIDLWGLFQSADKQAQQWVFKSEKQAEKAAFERNQYYGQNLKGGEFYVGTEEQLSKMHVTSKMPKSAKKVKHVKLDNPEINALGWVAVNINPAITSIADSVNHMGVVEVPVDQISTLKRAIKKGLSQPRPRDAWGYFKKDMKSLLGKVERMSKEKERTFIANCVQAHLAEGIFDLHMAESNEQKTAGLEPFEALDDNEGMLFPFDEPWHATFHMGAVKFPIDIIFLQEDDLMGLRVAKIVHNAQPGASERWSCQDTPVVIELKGGAAKANKIKIGTVCQLEDNRFV